MASLLFQPYHSFIAAMANKEIDFNSDDLRYTLHSSAYLPNLAGHDYFDDATNELATGGGYTAGGATLTGATITKVAANAWSQAWAAATTYLVGQLRRPTAGNGFLYRCSVAGTSGAGEPAWPTVVGQTVDDNGTIWTCVGSGAIVLSHTGPTPVWASFSAGPFRHVVLHDHTPGTNATRPLIGVFTYGADQTGGGGDFTITPDTSGGLVTIPLP